MPPFKVKGKTGLTKKQKEDIEKAVNKARDIAGKASLKEIELGRGGIRIKLPT